LNAENQSRERPTTALDRLESAIAWGRKNLEPARVSGVVTEVAMSHYRVAGL
jgi:hypothetical protein